MPFHAGNRPTKTQRYTPPDPFFRQTVLLLNGGSSPNGAQNNTFIDSSPNNFTITRNGNTTQGTFSPFSLPAGNWSNYFDGNGDWLNAANNAAFDFDSNNFTIECWFYLSENSLANNDGNRVATLFSCWSTGAGVTNGYQFTIDGNTTTTGTGFSLTRRLNSVNTFLSYTSTITKNTWHHVALVKDGSNMTIYYDGVNVAQNTSWSGSVLSGGYPFNIGALRFSGYLHQFNGYISNMRVVKGTAVYTSNFTVPTTPLTAITNTSLLTCQDNRFIDRSTNNFTLTRNGDTRVTAFSPFAPTAEYSASTNGGSAYYDGTGDYLVTTSGTNLNLGTGDFTIEMWVYFNSLTGDPHLFDQRISSGATAAPVALVTSTGQINTYRQNGILIQQSATGAVTVGQWTHIAWVRSGGVFNLYRNGVLVAGPTTLSFDFSSASPMYIGINSSAQSPINGYITDFRVVRGTAVYTAAFTPPTARLTAITNTGLLCNFTNAGITDLTAKNVLETVGNAQVNTAVRVFSTGSLSFDGTDDRLVFPATPDFQMGTGNFTIEGWIRRNDTNIRGIFQLCGTAGGLSGLNNLGLSVGSDVGQVWRIYANNQGYNSTATWAINTWYHFALVKSSGTTRLYIDGVQVISQSDTTNYSGQFLCVGGFYDTTFLMNGYIDDLRITNGIARYTTNFTPPSREFSRR